ncbi:L-ascorbate metabolism protein UlaG (beta-lactamase superfamily) [Anoxybacillus voinovskiensis]|uniref:L-ascorbate metabolism protein UlaG (Beta-lactamase superfamily) n=1 Tax=Anoxybacteroides voinovskiense TaxID=230470 RepID=A0A840DKY5_9BACL|nr:MBL fold metallo-hydrolase [Anoxybacillus voinovskiensis]MBB4072365.1 L-ascorbate metabolism protein UlaG (beta-lactamase superfamily) [Anoxybacillus voinovskiensis]GGJ58492.1 membrane protein [Anoxybacillus voinovskiensis]
MKRYENLDGVSTKKTFADFRRWQQERKQKKKDLSYNVPHVERPEYTQLHTNQSRPLLAWVGHSTFVMQINGITIVTDPVWALRMGIAKRLTAPGIPIEEMPPVDVVLISHGHYDHLHFASIKKLKGNPCFFVPVGLGCLFRRRGYPHVTEFSWWEEKEYKGSTFTFVPAQHWTRRTLFDMNTSHWGGWVVQATGQPTVYFAGDSGYFRGFREIGDRFAIDYALLPIGAYEPEWFMGPQHTTPEEAVQAFLDCRAKTFIPMHYGTFLLADDTPKEALDRLVAEWQRRQLEPERLTCLKLGEVLHCVTFSNEKAPIV